MSATLAEALRPRLNDATHTTPLIDTRALSGRVNGKSIPHRPTTTIGQIMDRTSGALLTTAVRKLLLDRHFHQTSQDKEKLIKYGFEMVKIPTFDGVEMTVYVLKSPTQNHAGATNNILSVHFPGFGKFASISNLLKAAGGAGELVDQAVKVHHHLRSQGLNITTALLDFPGYGNSGDRKKPANHTFGVLESFDIETAVAYLMQLSDSKSVLLTGNSAGAIALGNYLARLNSPLSYSGKTETRLGIEYLKKMNIAPVKLDQVIGGVLGVPPYGANDITNEVSLALGLSRSGRDKILQILKNTIPLALEPAWALGQIAQLIGQTPMLVTSAGADTIISPTAQAKVFEQLSSGTKRMSLLPQAKHDVATSQPNKFAHQTLNFLHDYNLLDK